MNFTQFANTKGNILTNITSIATMPIDCMEQIKSSHFLISTKVVNIFATIIIIIIGLFGNGLAVFVFAQKRFRLHSSSIYLLCLAISDGIFLLMHFFEDTLRTYIDVFLNGENDIDPNCYIFDQMQAPQQTNTSSSVKSILRTFNITDQFLFTCRLVNYFRYFLRFISAYIIVAFTIQRAIAIYSPLFQAKFESNRIAWVIILIIVGIGALLNLWVPFLFSQRDLKLNHHQLIQYCDVEKEYSKFYFRITIAYIIVTMLIPIIVIFLCNTVVIFNIIKANKKRQSMSNVNLITKSNTSTTLQLTNNKNTVIIFKPDESAYINNISMGKHLIRSEPIIHKLSPKFNKKKFAEELSLLETNSDSKIVIKKKSSPNQTNNNRKTNESQHSKITRMLLLMSLSYAILNLPYLISWSLFFFKVAFHQLSLTERFYMFSALNICEIFYILNYAIHFFIYCAAGKRFRAQLKDAFTFK